ncbi:MAG TPA: retroviral-like aspartic protease family protein [Myxococcota bacterium]|jgi:predicted aspartyl protease
MRLASSLLLPCVAALLACAPATTPAQHEHEHDTPPPAVADLLGAHTTPIALDVLTIGSLSTEVTTSTGTYRFIFDTGASVSVISFALADAQGLTHSSTSLQDLGAVRLGDLSLPSLEVVAIDLAQVTASSPEQIDGILGAPFLQAMGAYVDVPDQILWVSKNTAAPSAIDLAPAGLVAVPFLANHAGLLTVSVDAETADGLNAILDTGATATVLDTTVATSLALALHPGATSATVNGAIPADAATLTSLSVGDFSADNLEVAVMDLSSFNAQLAAAHDAPLRAIVGIDFMSAHGAVIAYPEGHVFFAP